MADKLNQNPYKTLSLKELKEMIFHDPKLEVANHATRLTWGQGYEILVINKETEEANEELTNKLKDAIEEAGFYGLVMRNEHAMSQFGYQINTIGFENGKLTFGEADTRFKSRVAKVEVDDVSAVVWKKFKYDDNDYIMIEKWDRLKVERSLMANNETVSLQGFNSSVPKDMQIKPIWNHNLGILPVKLFKNYERYISLPAQLVELADDYSVRNIPIAINQTFRTEIREQLMDVSRIFGNFTTAQLKKLKSKGVSYDEQLLAQMFIHVSQRGEGASTKLVEIQQANLSQLAPLIDTRLKNIKAYWTGCGYTYLNGEESLDTNASTLFSKGKDIETTKEKRNLRQRQYADMLKACLVAMNEIDAEQMKDIEVIFTIKENVVQSPEQIIDAELRLVEAGLQTKAEALARIRDIREQEAKAKIKKASEEQQEAKQQEAQMLLDMSSTGESSQMEPNPPADPTVEQ